MKKLGMLLGRSSRKERRFLFLSYILNVFFISTVLMLVCELWSSSVNLSGPDAAQSEMIATAVILVAVIVIAFFLWLISMELKGLYESRMQFNTNVRLMGLSNGNLMKLYLQGMGTSRRVLVKISNLQAAWNVLCVVLPVIGLTYVLTRAVCYLTMGAAYAIVTPIEVSPSRFVLLFAAWFAIYLAVQLFLVRRETKDGRCVEILRK